MTTKFDLTKVLTNNSETLKEDKDLSLNISTTHIKGNFSNELEISVESKDSDAFFSFMLNKNTALYLRNALDSFIKEKDIDISKED